MKDAAKTTSFKSSSAFAHPWLFGFLVHIIMHVCLVGMYMTTIQRTLHTFNSTILRAYKGKLNPRPSLVFQHYARKIGKAWLILRRNDYILDAVWDMIKNVCILAYATDLLLHIR